MKTLELTDEEMVTLEMLLDNEYAKLLVLGGTNEPASITIARDQILDILSKLNKEDENN